MKQLEMWTLIRIYIGTEELLWFLKCGIIYCGYAFKKKSSIF